jgi:nucleolar protein 58
MLCLFETPAGFALFKVLDSNRVKDYETLWEEFATPEKAAALVKLKAFSKFDNTKDAVAAAANLVRGSCETSSRGVVPSDFFPFCGCAVYGC